MGYDKELLDYLQKNWQTASNKDVSTLFEVSASKVSKHLAYLGLTNGKAKWRRDFVWNNRETMSYRQMAEVLGITIDGVRQCLKQATREHLEEI